MTVRVFTAEEMPESRYHADPCMELYGQPSLSSTIAKHILNRPSLAHYYHPQLGNGAPRKSWDKQTAAKRMGTMLHAHLLGSGPDFVVIKDHEKGKKIKGDPDGRTERDRDGHDYARDWRKAAVQASRDDALAAGQFPVLHTELPAVVEMTDALAPQLRDRGINQAGSQRETTIIWDEETEHGVIWMRARIDHYSFRDGELQIADLKKTVDASASGCNDAVRRFGYHIQASAYVDAMTRASPEYDQRIRYRLAFMELTPVPGVHVVSLDAAYCVLGDCLWAKAKALWARCLHTNEWPGLPNATTILEAPDWFILKEMP